VILGAATDPAWVDAAVREWRVLLIDHANCEKKAASTALALLFAYPEDRALTARLSRLAREELRHFEQVDRMLDRLDVPAQRLAPGRYAGGLRRAVSRDEPRRKLDLMLCGALIEARSCERFELLATRLPAPLGDFYAGLAEAERRHAGLYLQLARDASEQAFTTDCEQEYARRLELLAGEEAALATNLDPAFRFHSGTPQTVA
jgi:tRNA 2-(methylsulfanyl)-N6-isopentenyladenosine37 hydroxylase